MKKGFTLRRGVAERKRGFTLIELIVAVVIFMIIFLITASFVSLASGQVISLRTKMLTNDVRNTFETINQKANNANANISIGVDDIYGLASIGPIVDLDNDILLVVFQTGSGNCLASYFAKKTNTDAIFIYEEEYNNCIPTGLPSAADFTQRMNSEDVKITNFSVSQNDIGSIPYVTIEIYAQDAQPQYENDNQIKMRSSFTVDYLMRNNM